MRTDLFDYELPPELIAQTPAERGTSRLLVMDRRSGQIAHRRFTDIIEYLRPGDCLVINNTRVSARRLHATRENGFPAEILLLHPVGDTFWHVLARPGKSLRPGKRLWIQNPPDGSSLQVSVIAQTAEGGRILDFGNREARDRAAQWGEVPLPPYIACPLPPDQEERYQTVYAAEPGSVAAPTAGLHFTESLLQQLRQQQILLATVTLHVGIGTFRPVRTEEIEAHEMHAEVCFLSEETAQKINTAPGRIVAVGTTSVRTLETAARVARATPKPEYPRVAPFAGETRLFLYPGTPFYATDAMVTNFHLPRSTLLMLVAAFSSREYILNAYAEAVRERYRFFSFGDAMLIL